MSSSGSSAGKSLLQNAVYVGMNIENILYGVELVLYFKTMGILLRDRRMRNKSDLFYAVFSSVMLFMTTVWVATTAIFGEKMWLLNSDFPGGPDAFFQANISDWYLDWGTTSIIVLQLMTDGLMIYRCRVIWNSYRVIILPIFLWVCTLVLSVLVDWTSSSPGGNFFVGVAAQIALAYYTVSVFLNLVLTSLICYRIVRYGKWVQESLGNEYASLYFAIATVVVESVLPYTLSGIAFLVAQGIGSSVSEALISVYILMMCISPQMLILRVLAGRAWDTDTSTKLDSMIQFGPGEMSRPQRIEINRDSVQLQPLSKAHFSDGEGKV